MSKKLIVCLVGMPGAGKSTIASGLATLGHDIINMGDAIRAEAGRRRAKPTSKNLGIIMMEMRSQYGPGAVAYLIKPQVMRARSDVIIVDGVRSTDEIKVLRECGVVRVLAIHASQDKRFVFLKKRRRSDDPENLQMLQDRDRREMGVGISDPIALADESISNNSLNKDALISAAAETIQRWK
ncbi:MAG: AAA family ATPase [Cenarchaeum sp. SB0661_bin_35]|nr:AAA family ATPase [Cenarchaeum sp. SB0667_bin_13]MXZ94156.1 AAA family ATPase [Cenarchaeum sp. SB0666_bin_15]MYC79019.1 AAA family ATPase [Cenarchaeum sp. SB0661_bin_35]MYD58090.1 AAA family ATPase [Cenarchaeum sp. SB0678_bin_8]MYJ27485.1 AAA family ATPase [Cenarchaeum sp. SB0672_bin_9]